MTRVLMPGGFSDAAIYIDESTSKERRQLHKSHAFGIDSVLREELGTVWEECRHSNWDGYQAVAMSRDTLQNAYVFLESLPLGYPAPSVGAEPDGNLTLEWHRAPRRTLSISITPEGDIHYAALFGPNRVYGTEAFFGEVPLNILGLIRRAYTA